MRVAVIGCGGAGIQHVRSYLGLEGVDLVGVCDVDDPRAQRAAEMSGAHPYARVDELLKAEQPDLVSVCTREYGHVEPAIQALRAGCHVFCEKPLAHTVDEARRMVAAAQSVGKILGIDYNYRHIPAFAALREEIRRGAFGEVVLLNVGAHAFCYHHAIDLTRFLLGEVAEVCASVNDAQERRGYPWDTPEAFLYVPSVSVAATLRMRSGATVVLTASRMRALEDTLLDLEVIGTAGRCALRTLPVNDARPRRVETWPHDEALDARLGLDGGATPPFSLNDAFTASIRAFVQALASGQPVPTDGSDGVMTLAIDHAVVQAHRYGAVVRLMG